MKELVSLDPDALIQTVVEIRFSTDYPSEAVFGSLYLQLEKDYPKNETTNLVQLPKNLRENDPNLQYSALYSISNESIIIHVGPKVIYFDCHNGYLRWSNYYPEIIKVLDSIQNINLIKNVERVGLRYINFFEEEKISTFLKASISIMSDEYERDAIAVASQYKIDNNKANVRVTCPAINNKNPTQKGTLLDIDVFSDESFNYQKGKLESIISSLHSTEKTLFTELVKDDYLIEKHNAEFK